MAKRTRKIAMDEDLASNLVREMKRNPNSAINQLVDDLCQGKRKALAEAITLVESNRTDHRMMALELLSALRQGHPRQAIRLSVTGTPGVGKSTFIEAFGMFLVSAGLKVAVLAIDPTSQASGGSILGDKTRMQRLARQDRAYVRSSPTGRQFGGIAPRTSETVFVCEQAGFDVIIIETVGVGQTDYMVADTSDIFVLLIAPEGGDELQGIKRGIMEVADLILVNKADDDLASAAKRTASEYSMALKLFQRRGKDPKGYPKVNLVSALKQTGIETAWKDICFLVDWRRTEGVWDETRSEQQVLRFQAELQKELTRLFSQDQNLQKMEADLEEAVREGQEEPLMAVQKIVQTLEIKSVDDHLDN